MNAFVHQPFAPLSTQGHPAARGTLLAALGLGIFTVLWLTHLWPQWTENPDLSHAFFTPVLFIYLLRRSRQAEAGRFIASAALEIGLASGLAFLALAALALGLVYAIAVEWTSSLVLFLITGALALGWLAWSAAAASTVRRLVPWGWITLCAAALWVLSAPLPPGSYSRLTLHLQLAISSGVLNALNLIGVPATLSGNVIHLANTSVGVEEACSGVRSLISCIYTGIFLSAALDLRPWARAVLIGLAGPLALSMNFARSLTLTLLANRGTDITGGWHDVTGFAILGITALLLGALAFKLESPPAVQTQRATQPLETVKPRRAAPIIILASLAIATVCCTWVVRQTRPAATATEAPPDLAAILPAASDRWQAAIDTDLYEFSDTLHTTHLIQRSYYRTRRGHTEQFTVYLAYWPAGQVPVSLVATHTPDACWPGSGWALSGQPNLPPTLRTATAVLPPAQERTFAQNGRTQHVWYWHLYDGRPITQLNPRSVGELLTLILRFGPRSAGSQVFVRFSSNLDWSELANDPLVNDIVNHLKPLGLIPLDAT